MPLTPREIKQAKLSGASAGNPQLVIPKIPSRPIPAKVAAAFPDLKKWQDDNTAEMEAWRVKTNIAVLGFAPP